LPVASRIKVVISQHPIIPSLRTDNFLLTTSCTTRVYRAAKRAPTPKRPAATKLPCPAAALAVTTAGPEVVTVAFLGGEVTLAPVVTAATVVDTVVAATLAEELTGATEAEVAGAAEALLLGMLRVTPA